MSATISESVLTHILRKYTSAIVRAYASDGLYDDRGRLICSGAEMVKAHRGAEAFVETLHDGYCLSVDIFEGRREICL